MGMVSINHHMESKDVEDGRIANFLNQLTNQLLIHKKKKEVKIY